MHQYELMVILDPEIDERTVAPSLDKFLNVIRNDGGTIDKVDVWGRRRLAYEINKKTEGIYAVVALTSNAAATVELDRQLKLSEAVMRTKVLRAEEAIAQVAEAAKLSAEKAARKRRADPVEGAAASAKTSAVQDAPASSPSSAAPAATPARAAAPAGSTSAPTAAPASTPAKADPAAAETAAAETAAAETPAAETPAPPVTAAE